MNRRSLLGVIGLVAVPVMATILYFPSASLAISNESVAVKAFEQNLAETVVASESARPAQDNVALVEWSYTGKGNDNGKGKGPPFNVPPVSFQGNTIIININITIIIIININGSPFSFTTTGLA